ncbi:hypothetical protein [Agromyces albus]|uniref:hypothetical protein n=1 Tax=Agromyces albus TaxID=205332 RepID=UPI0013E9431E|nr:hypothetical protein [Agromyces albus]
MRDENEDREFWARVHRENAQLSTAERQVYVDGGTLGDDLDDAGDDALSERAEW